MTAWTDGVRHDRVEAGSLKVGDILRLRLGATIDPKELPSLPMPAAQEMKDGKAVAPMEFAVSAGR